METKIYKLNRYKPTLLIRGVKLFCAVILLNVLTGCIGAGVFYPSNIECTYKEDGSSFDKNGKKNLWCQSFIKKEQILSRYGEPNKIEKINQNEEKWTYKEDGFRWVGIMPMIVIPIPIGIPVARKYNYIYFKNDVLSKKDWQYTKILGTWCGYLGIRPVPQQGKLCISEEIS